MVTLVGFIMRPGILRLKSVIHRVDHLVSVIPIERRKGRVTLLIFICWLKILLCSIWLIGAFVQ